MAASPQLSALLHFQQRPKTTVSTGIGPFDAIAGGLPCGAITEIYGAASSGRTSLMLGLLAASSRRGEVCALVDASDSLDPSCSAAAGVRLENLVWVRCRGDAGHAFKAADLLLHGGGFGLVVLDLCDVPRRILQKVPLSYWYRFRRAVEDTPTSLVVVSTEPQSKSCATLLLEARNRRVDLAGAPGFHLLRGVDLEFASKKPVNQRTANLRAESTSARTA
ncbi:MAG: hypothetical protein ABI693_15210 [Bryobacteraceae bacterium]